MKIGVNEIKTGQIIECKGKKCVVLKKESVKPGKGPSYMQLELRDLESGRKVMESLVTSGTVEKLDSREKSCTYMYSDGDDVYFMDSETYDQFSVKKSLLGEKYPFLQDGMEVKIHFVENDPIDVTLPNSSFWTVEETEPVVKGQTAASSNKPAILNNGVRIMVPTFINQGDEILVNSNDLLYMERAKKN
ncbi:MAG: elongation factor P [Rickettsiales bacterium]|jgi:elongation factor P|nr:elongation factor P [Rickettsiales bacterium]